MGPVQAIEHPGMDKFMLQQTPQVPQLTYTPHNTGPPPSYAPPPQDFVPPHNNYQKLRALYDFESPEPGDLPFRAGEELSVISDAGSGWLNAMNAAGRSGLVPANYLQ